MKLCAEIAEEKLDLEIKRDGDRVIGSIDGKPREFDVRQVDDAVYLLFAGNRTYECRVEDRPGGSDVYVGGRLFQINIADPKRLRSGYASGGHDGGPARIAAPMPGKVVRVLVEAGAQVETGDGLIVVEAMKMQNEMKSPKAGTVIQINAVPGVAVNAGDVLVVVE
jgi:biotin carboxyl carrier protein